MRNRLMAMLVLGGAACAPAMAANLNFSHPILGANLIENRAEVFRNLNFSTANGALTPPDFFNDGVFFSGPGTGVLQAPPLTQNSDLDTVALTAGSGQIYDVGVTGGPNQVSGQAFSQARWQHLGDNGDPAWWLHSADASTNLQAAWMQEGTAQYNMSGTLDFLALHGNGSVQFAIDRWDGVSFFFGSPNWEFSWFATSLNNTAGSMDETVVLEDGYVYRLYVQVSASARFVEGQREVNANSTFTYAFTEVPAPGSAALLGLAGLVATRRRR